MNVKVVICMPVPRHLWIHSVAFMNITKNKVFSTLGHKYSEFGTRKMGFLQLFTSI